MKIEDKDPIWLSIKEKCFLGYQCCDECNDLECGDNTNDIVEELKKLREVKNKFPTLEETLKDLDYTNEMFGSAHAAFVNAIDSTYNYIKQKVYEKKTPRNK